MTKFKIGDKVRVLDSADVRAVDPSGETKHGDVLVVKDIWEGVPYPVYTDMEKHICWPVEDLELISESV